MLNQLPATPVSLDAWAVRPALVVLLVPVSVVSLGCGVGLSLLQLYLAQYLPGTTRQTLAWHVGMLGGIYTLTLFVFASWWGRQSDHRGWVAALTTGFAMFVLGTAMVALIPSLMAIYGGRLIVGAGTAAIVPGAQTCMTDISNTKGRSRCFVLIGSASFAGFLAGPVFGSWLAGPLTGMPADQMPSMVNQPALVVVSVGLPPLSAARRCLSTTKPILLDSGSVQMTQQRKRFVAVSILLALLASFVAGTLEVGFSLFGGQTSCLPNSMIAVMFVTCSLVMLAARASLPLPAVCKHIDHRWVAGAFAGSVVTLGSAALVFDAVALGLLIAVVAIGVGMIGPVLSYELLEGDRSLAGSLSARQTVAGNLGQALGSVSAGTLFGWNTLASLWVAAAVLLLGSVVALHWWGAARQVGRQPKQRSFQAEGER